MLGGLAFRTTVGFELALGVLCGLAFLTTVGSELARGVLGGPAFLIRPSHAFSAADSGESHFTVVIEAAAFASMSRLARQRAVIAALGDIVGQRVHAVAIKASAPAL